MNREAIKIRNMKQKLWRKYTATRSITDYCKYVKCKNHLRNLTRDLRNKLKKSLANNSKTSPKPFWSYVKSKLKTRTKILTLKKADGTKARDAKDKAQALNVFFGSAYQQECNIIPPVTKNYNGIPLCSIKITNEMVMDKLKSLNPGKSTGPDGLLCLADELYVPINCTINLWLKEWYPLNG